MKFYLYIAMISTILFSFSGLAMAEDLKINIARRGVNYYYYDYPGYYNYGNYYGNNPYYYYYTPGIQYYYGGHFHHGW